jgi:hypothetical protein
MGKDTQRIPNTNQKTSTHQQTSTNQQNRPSLLAIIKDRLFTMLTFLVDAVFSLAIFLVCYFLEWLREHFFPGADGPILWLWILAIYSGYVIASGLIIRITIVAIARIVKNIIESISKLF